MARPPYDDLPAQVRAAVEQLLGWPVVEALSQSGGWSPGVAARLRGPLGERAFVKAVSSEVNPRSPDMHRDEARLTALLPESLGSPRLLGSYDDGTWVALVFEEIDGHQPSLPWQPDELAAALAAMDRLAQVPAPPGVPSVVEAWGPEFGWWQELGDPPAGIDPWLARNAERIAELESGWAEAASGSALLHLDLRGDNMLVRDSGPRAGEVVLVDWPWACAGSPVFDVAGFAPSAVLDGAPSCESVLQGTRAGREADPEAVDALVAALAGFFALGALQPPPPGLDGVRAFQAAQGEVAVAWLRERTGWS